MFGIDEAIADSTNSLFLVGSNIIRMKSSRHVWLFVPLLTLGNLLHTSLDPPFLLSAFASFVRVLWFVRLRLHFSFDSSSPGGGTCNCKTETGSLTPAAFGVS